MSVIKLTGIGKPIHVTNMTSTDIDPKIGFTITPTQQGDASQPEITTIQTIAEAAGNFDFDGFTINSANNIKQYYLYAVVDNVIKDPRFVDRIGVPFYISATDVANVVAIAVQTAIDALPEFDATVLTDTVTVTNVDNGVCDDAEDGYGYDLSVVSDLDIFKIIGYVWNDYTRVQSSGNRLDYRQTKEWVCIRVARDKFEWISG